MPKFIGNKIAGAEQIEDNAKETPTRVRITYVQAKKLPPSAVMCSLDTTDRGSKGSYAKRWYRWFADPSAIHMSPHATVKTRRRAINAGLRPVGEMKR